MTKARNRAAADTNAGGKPRLIADDLRDRILGGEFQEGDQLGTEAELLELFDVSRPSLREALRILEAEGFVSIVRGVLGGVIVHLPDRRMTARAAAVLLHSREVDLADVFETSAILEPAAARLTALGRGRHGAARRLRAVIGEQKLSINDPARFAGAVQRFHQEIIDSAGNKTLVIVTEMLDEVIARAITDIRSRSADEPIAYRRRAIRSHEQLAELIDTGDGDGAHAHWTGHMARARRHLLGHNGPIAIDLSRHR